jgi:hypothetical protein
MRKLLILTAALLLLCSGSVFAQANYNINIGGLPITSGSAVPGSCPVDGALFFKNSATESWNVCISGAYSALGGGGAPSFPLLAPAATLNSYSFTGSTTTGMGSSGTNILDFSANAHNQLRINADGSMAFDSGTLGNVSFFIDNGFGTHAGQILRDATTGGISIFAIAGDATWGAGGSAGDVNFTTAAANKVISLRPSSGISYADKTAKAE